ncbi:AbiH family protein [Alistipes finegoldii]|uniref:AbiH family protein n=1 Tax=Alistipes finegoldii TaxID=214856 RepID=UPI0018974D69|nr:AbiH family protein [Alistipes finegoldii]
MKTDTIKKYSVVVIIGNGFDLNLGLKTSYQDFIKSSYFEHLIGKNNALCIYLQSKLHLKRWIDIEKELSQYSYESEKIDRLKFRAEYIELCDVLCDYLNSLDISKIDKSSYAYTRLKSTLSSEDMLIIDFNYTKSVESIVKELDTPCKCDIIKIHGKAAEHNIIFGVEDDARINPEDVFLLKAAHKDYTTIDIGTHLKNSEGLVVIGHSLGQSDYHYFQNFFREQSSIIVNSKHILITYFQEQSRLEIMQSLVNLTNHSLSRLRTKNQFKMVDVSEHQPES